MPLEVPGPPRAAFIPSQELPRCCAALEVAVVMPGGNSQLRSPQHSPGWTGWAGHASPGTGIGTARSFHATPGHCCQQQGQQAVSLPLTRPFPSCGLWGQPFWPGNVLVASQDSAAHARQGWGNHGLASLYTGSLVGRSPQGQPAWRGENGNRKFLPLSFFFFFLS